MKNILVPIGSNKHTANILQYAIDFVEGTGAKIYIIRVYGVSKTASSMKNIDSVLEEDSNKVLADVLKEVDAKGVEIISKSVKGGVADSIQRVAKRLDIDMIVSSSKALSKSKKVFLGRIAGSLIKNTNIPILIVPKEQQFKKIGKVLMAVKSCNVASSEVLAPLKDVLRRNKASLDLLKVVTPHCDANDTSMDQELDALQSNFKITENATVFQGVLEYIRELEPDMLCVIRRKRGFFTRLWQDDRVYKKDFESRLPLLILKGASV